MTARQSSSTWVCACCSNPIDQVDIKVVYDATGAARLTAESPRGHAALTAMLSNVAITIDDARLPLLLDIFVQQGLRCARPADERWLVLDDDD